MKLTLLEKGYLKYGTFVLKGLHKFKMPTNWLYEYKHNIILRYIESNHKELIGRYKTITPPLLGLINSTSPIYVMWYQGEEQMPPIVKVSYASIKAHAGEHPVVLVTKDNVRQLLADVPLWDDEIFDYIKSKKATLTQFADFFRLCILYSKGGIWIDATVLVNWDIDRITEGLTFVSGRREGVKDKNHVVQGKWTTYFIGCSKGNLLMKFMYELLFEHLKHEGRFVDYFMIDYSFVTAYNNLPYVKEMVDAIPPMPHRFFELQMIRNKGFSPSNYDKMCEEVPFFKMTYKGILNKTTADGKPTYYKYITEGHG